MSLPWSQNYRSWRTIKYSNLQQLLLYLNISFSAEETSKQNQKLKDNQIFCIIKKKRILHRASTVNHRILDASWKFFDENVLVIIKKKLKNKKK